jgi:CheY-like chemotaxis protein
VNTNQVILLVEDNEDDVFLMKRALKRVGVINSLFVVEDGQEAFDYLGGFGKFSERATYPSPAMVFLDLKLPFKSGHEILAWIREQKEFEPMVVVVLTSSNEPSDITKSYQLGANSFLVKPPTVEKLRAVLKAFKWNFIEFERAVSSDRHCENWN